MFRVGSVPSLFIKEICRKLRPLFFVIAHGLSLDESGELYEAFDNKFSLSTSKERKLLSLSSGGWIGIINQKQQNKTFLILHTNKKKERDIR